MKNIINLLIILIFISAFSSIIKSRELNESFWLVIKIINEEGTPVEGIRVYLPFNNNNSAQGSVTNAEGIAKLPVAVGETPYIIYIADGRNNPQYGVKAYIPNMSAYEYIIEIPYFPRDKNEAVFQLDNLLSVVSESYGYYSAAEFIAKGFSSTLSSHGVGVPGLFSINPIPAPGSDGKLGWRLSGTLVEKIMTVFMDAKKKILGINFDYYYHPY
ncbi:MAG: hypothetical protein Kow0098_27500 [Ignavibacteriaceae bacterium]